MPNAPKVLQAYNGALLKRKQKRLDKKHREAAAAKAAANRAKAEAEAENKSE